MKSLRLQAHILLTYCHIDKVFTIFRFFIKKFLFSDWLIWRYKRTLIILISLNNKAQGCYRFIFIFISETPRQNRLVEFTSQSRKMALKHSVTHLTFYVLFLFFIKKNKTFSIIAVYMFKNKFLFTELRLF